LTRREGGKANHGISEEGGTQPEYVSPFTGQSTRERTKNKHKEKAWGQKESEKIKFPIKKKKGTPALRDRDFLA